MMPINDKTDGASLDEKILSALMSVFERLNEIETSTKATHGLALDVWGAMKKQGDDITSLKSTVYGADGAGGLVADVKALKAYGVGVPRWVYILAVPALLILFFAAVSIIFLTALAVREIAPGVLLWP